MRISLFLLFLLLVGCYGRSTTGGGSRDIARDGGCEGADEGLPGMLVPCSGSDDCLASYAPNSPTGTLHAVCLRGTCHAAESCVETHAGAPDYCTCGDERVSFDFGCYGACLQLAGASKPGCVPTCM